jgi:hypothetical protein
MMKRPLEISPRGGDQVLGFKDFQGPLLVGIRFNTQGCHSVAGGYFTNTLNILEILEISNLFLKMVVLLSRGCRSHSLVVTIVYPSYTGPLASFYNPIIKLYIALRLFDTVLVVPDRL